MLFRIILIPIIGAIIGLFTNDIAVKMLFHPRKPIHIGKFKLPFTPGLIPKEKNRIAKSIGNAVSTQLFDEDTLGTIFLSDETIEKIENGIAAFVEKNKNNDDTLEETISKLLSKEDALQLETNVKENLSEVIHKKLVAFQFGETIAENTVNKIRTKINEYSTGFISSFLDDRLILTIAKSAGEIVDTIIADNSKEIIKNLIEKEIDNVKEKKISEIISQYENKISYATDKFISLYQKTIKENLKLIISSINISKIIEDKIIAFDVIELENLIFSVMKKELKAIVWLGGLLGYIMGWLNLLITEVL